jgi:hypothetical protein
MHYNEAFADKQGISAVDRQRLDSKYEELFAVLENPSEWNSPEAQVRKIEFDLQKLWKFPQDPKFHRYQLEIKGCTCPRLDNFELFGHTADRYRVSDCPWHWKPEDDIRVQNAYADRQKLMEERRNEV